MFVIEINGIDSSAHTLETDALAQKARFINTGVSEQTIAIVEKNEFNPPVAPL